MFKKLKDLFIVSDDKFKDEVSNGTPQSPSPQKSNKAEVNTSKLEKPRKVEGSANPKFMDILLAAIEKHNMDGFDYLEFKQSLRNLKDLSMDEATKYSSAIAMAKTMGASSDTINQSANHYLSVLKSEEEKFKKALLAQKQKIDQDKTTGLEQMKNTIASKEQKIKEIQAEIEADKKKLEQKISNIKKSDSKIQTTHDHFSHAYSIIVDQIVSDVNNINKYTK